jgi:hypothetical protein
MDYYYYCIYFVQGFVIKLAGITTTTTTTTTTAAAAAAAANLHAYCN